MLLGDGLDGFWSVVLKNIKVGSSAILNSEATGVLDTGASVIVGPHLQVGLLAAKIGAHCLKFSDSSSDIEEVITVLFFA